jgi:hypothetical protein
MVELNPKTHEETEQEVADKREKQNWADEVDGGDDDDTEIGGADVAPVPKPEEKAPVYNIEKRVRNANGDFVVTTIKLKELEARPVEKVEVEEEEEESEESEQEE